MVGTDVISHCNHLHPLLVHCRRTKAFSFVPNLPPFYFIVFRHATANTPVSSVQRILSTCPPWFLLQYFGCFSVALIDHLLLRWLIWPTNLTFYSHYSYMNIFNHCSLWCSFAVFPCYYTHFSYTPLWALINFPNLSWEAKLPNSMQWLAGYTDFHTFLHSDRFLFMILLFTKSSPSSYFSLPEIFCLGWVCLNHLFHIHLSS